MADDPVIAFVVLHTLCGEIVWEWGPDVVSVRCVRCGAVVSVNEQEHPETLARLVTLYEDAATISAVDLLVVSNPASTTEEIERVLDAHPKLRTTLEAMWKRHQHDHTKH